MNNFSTPLIKAGTYNFNINFIVLFLQFLGCCINRSSLYMYVHAFFLSTVVFYVIICVKYTMYDIERVHVHQEMIVCAKFEIATGYFHPGMFIQTCALIPLQYEFLR